MPHALLPTSFVLGKTRTFIQRGATSTTTCSTTLATQTRTPRDAHGGAAWPRALPVPVLPPARAPPALAAGSWCCCPACACSVSVSGGFSCRSRVPHLLLLLLCLWLRLVPSSPLCAPRPGLLLRRPSALCLVHRLAACRTASRPRVLRVLRGQWRPRGLSQSLLIFDSLSPPLGAPSLSSCARSLCALSLTQLASRSASHPLARRPLPLVLLLLLFPASSRAPPAPVSVLVLFRVLRPRFVDSLLVLLRSRPSNSLARSCRALLNSRLWRPSAVQASSPARAARHSATLSGSRALSASRPPPRLPPSVRGAARVRERSDLLSALRR